MSHELATQNDGRIAMAYCGDKPWHGLGQELPCTAQLEEWEAAAGFDFKIQRARVRYSIGPHESDPVLTIDDRLVLFRGDNGKDLGIVSPRYKVVQPREILHFFSDLIGAAGFRMESAGVLFNGRQYWALARVTEDAVIVGNDRVGGFLLLHTSSDGTGATTATFTTTRVVCNNTVRMALDEKTPGRVVLTHRSEFDPTAIKSQLGVGRVLFGDFVDAAKALAQVKVSEERAKLFVANLLEPKFKELIASTRPEDVRKTENLVASKAFVRILALWSGEGDGATLPGVAGTAWGVVNAVTQYADRENRSRTMEGKIDSAWFGDADALKTRALRMAVGTIA